MNTKKIRKYIKSCKGKNITCRHMTRKNWPRSKAIEVGLLYGYGLEDTSLQDIILKGWEKGEVYPVHDGFYIKKEFYPVHDGFYIKKEFYKAYPAFEKYKKA